MADSTKLDEKNMIGEIAEYIISVGTENTTTGNWHVDYDELSEVFDFATLDYLHQHHDEILYALDTSAEILSETWTDYDENGQPNGFDCNFALAYCPNKKEHRKMNNYTIDERNAVVVAHLPCIDSVMRRNRSLIEAAHLDRDDVYQQLALRLIRAVDTFDEKKGKLKSHIYAQLKYEMLNCKRPYRLNGITGLPTDYRGRCSSLDSLVESGVAV